MPIIDLTYPEGALSAVQRAELSQRVDDGPAERRRAPLVQSEANTIIRDRMAKAMPRARCDQRHPRRARRVENGGMVRADTEAGSAKALVDVSETMQPGDILLPNGLGLDFTDEDGGQRKPGVAPNGLTSVRHRDRLAAAPRHKHAPVRLEPIR
jgi:anaerobic selenocysteine-containing dehydrogenase